MTLAIIAITSGGALLARRLHQQVVEAELWLPDRFRRADDAHYFDEKPAELLPRLFLRVDGLICIMATGIVVRLLGAQLQGKDRDAAVVVCDEKGQFAISLLSGHLGGANELAAEVAERLGAASPSDLVALDVSSYKGLVAPWNDWRHLEERGRFWAPVVAKVALESTP